MRKESHGTTYESTGEFRKPKHGEHYVSGSSVLRAGGQQSDYEEGFIIMKPVVVPKTILLTRKEEDWLKARPTSLSEVEFGVSATFNREHEATLKHYSSGTANSIKEKLNV